ncbi:hypothetical protein ACFLWB_00850 [Chloroflexota bacterium]
MKSTKWMNTCRGSDVKGIRRKTSRIGILRRLIIAVILTLYLVPISSSPATAISLSDYFSYSSDVTLDKTEIVGTETFYMTVEAEATCNKDLPLPASEAKITGRITAEHQASGSKVTLNPSYTVAVDPFPNEEGETAQSYQVVPLQFPQGSQSGTYSVVAELVEAKVKAIFWITGTDYLPSSQAVGSVTYTSGSAAGGAAGGGAVVTPPPAPGLPPGTSDVSGFVSTDGTFTETVVAESLDRKSALTINEGTRGLTQDGDRLTQISIAKIGESPAPPRDSNVVGLTYNLGPDGATFDPPITITFTYDPDDIPEGIAEENLVIALWDEATGEWVLLVGSIIDPVTHTITAPVTHFTAFTVLAYAVRAVTAPSAQSVPPSPPTPQASSAQPLAPTPSTPPRAPPVPPVNRWLVGGIIAAIIIVGAIIWRVVAHHKASLTGLEIGKTRKEDE